MWFQSTSLVHASGRRRFGPRARRIPQWDSLLLGEHDWKVLLRREAAVRAFALGGTPLDVNDYASATALFVDVHADVRDPTTDFPSQQIIGLPGRELSLISLDFSSSGLVAISIAVLEQHASPASAPPNQVVWTMTWQYSNGTWLILNSQASASLGAR